MHASVVCRSVAKAAYLIRGMEKRLDLQETLPCTIESGRWLSNFACISVGEQW